MSMSGRPAPFSSLPRICDGACSTANQVELRRQRIQISMSEKSNCFDNAVVEIFFKTFKSELVWRTVFQTRAEAKGALGRYIDGSIIPSGFT